MEGDAKIRLGHCDDEEDVEGGEDRGRRRYKDKLHLKNHTPQLRTKYHYYSPAVVRSPYEVRQQSI